MLDIKKRQSKLIEDAVLERERTGKDWPRPYVHFGGVVQIVDSQEEWDALVWHTDMAVVVAIILSILWVVFLTSPS